VRTASSGVVTLTTIVETVLSAEAAVARNRLSALLQSHKIAVGASAALAATIAS
jgi:hypothetical protein